MTHRPGGKTCYVCMTFKSFASFPKDRTTRDGYANRCTVCRNRQTKRDAS